MNVFLHFLIKCKALSALITPCIIWLIFLLMLTYCAVTVYCLGKRTICHEQLK